MGLGKALLDLLFPPKCAVCGKLLDGDDHTGICPACDNDLPRTAREERKVDFLSSVSAALYYEGDTRRMILRYKFENVPALSRPMGRLIGEKLRTDAIPFDVLTWVPLSTRRFRQRGYDQAKLLAEAVGEEMGTRPAALLRKIRHVHPQSDLRTPEERRANISGAYAVLPGADVRGKRILLVDDVITTGSTVSECARMLLMAGAAEVRAVSVAFPRRDKKTGNITLR